MALVTLQRSSSASPEADMTDGAGDESEDEVVPTSPTVRSSRASSYLAVKGAAMILPQSEGHRQITRNSLSGHIAHHLQSMFYLLRPQDQIKIVVKLQSSYNHENRYMVVVSCLGRQDTDECAILGVDVETDTTIGLVFPIWADMSIRLDGDGGFAVSSQERSLFFKPVSVQAMWSALQCLHRVSDISRTHYYFPGGLTHTWLGYYQSKILSSQSRINEWEAMDDLMVLRENVISNNCDTASLEIKIRIKLKEIMMKVDLEEVTTLYLRMEVERSLGVDLKAYKSFIDQETMTILGQLDKPSMVLDYLFLGSEWNASNLDELKQNGIGYILNVTREIDNFFPGMFEYMNIRVYDNVQSDLMRFWEKTYKFIKRAQENKSKCLVHCKMGISRSASTVIAFLMKEFNWSSEKSMNYTVNIRSCINPNESFRAQLLTYEGILDASNQRHNELFQPSLPENLHSKEDEELEYDESQGTLKEIAEEILASKYGRPPPNPFYLDDVELSSRSRDSIEECFPEIPLSVNSDGDSIKLIYYRRLSDQIAQPIITASIVVDKDQTSSSSDSSELTVAFYNCLRAHERGQYSRHCPAVATVKRNDNGTASQFVPIDDGRVDPRRLTPAERFSRDGKIEIKGELLESVPVIDLGPGLLGETCADDDDLTVKTATEMEGEASTTLDVCDASASPTCGPSAADAENADVPTSPPPVSQRKKAKISSSTASNSTDEGLEVFHIGYEEIVVKKGKVKRHTADFEQRQSDLSVKDFDGELDETEIPPKGVVKVQMEAFESRASPASFISVSPAPSSPKESSFHGNCPTSEREVKDESHDEERELPSAGIVELYRKNYERDSSETVKKVVRKVLSDPMSKPDPGTSRKCELECDESTNEEEQVPVKNEEEQVPVKNLVHKFERSSPSEEQPALEDGLSASAPASPVKISSRRKSFIPTAQDEAELKVETRKRQGKTHGKTHPLERLSDKDPFFRNTFYQTM